MSASANLCTRDSVKTHLGLSGSTYDNVIDALIPAASEAIENTCGRRFAQASYTDYRDGDGLDRIVLRRRPVTEVAGVWDDPARTFGDATKLDADEYVLDAERGIVLLRAGTFSEGVRNVKVSYTAGAAAVPDDVAQACRMLVAAWFHAAREGGDGLDARTAGETALRFSAEPMPAPVARIIERYREHTV